jgi:hypothetical protein
MSIYWTPLQMQNKITQIIDVQSHEPSHHFGRPFMTPYQIAIKFRQNFPSEFNKIGKPVGGKGVEQQDSLAQYIALELSKRIQSGEISNIEGRFLKRDYLDILRYKYDGEEIISSSGQAYDLSMFRRID